MKGLPAKFGLMRVNPRMKLGAKVAAMVLTAAALMPVSAETQKQSNHKSQKADSGWDLSVISAALPKKVATKIHGRIEKEKFVCWTSDSVLLEVPLNSITQVSRDTGKDYTASRWLMAVATHPSGKRPIISSRKYRDELKGRVALGLFAMIAGLFPARKEVVRITWTSEAGQLDAIFLMGRSQGRALLVAIRKETGLEPQDLEQERKKQDEWTRSLSRQNGRHSDPAREEK